ncbi:MAG TPA: paraquat-inducible protein A [Thermoanaerobaculia bacterium]|jgi:paraquat-inducible protein A|nr:paraquat-inducible protein A [Thermoanaerobaculia bacterium]
MIPELPPGSIAECHRCDRLLARVRAGVDVSFACAVAVFLLLPPAFFLPLFASTVKELVFATSRLVSSVPVIYSEVWFPFAFGFLFFAFLFPAVRALLQIVVLGSVRFGWPIPQPGRWFRWSEELRMWSMTDIVCVAGLIAYYRASVSAAIEVDVGAWCYFAVAILSFAGDWALDRRAVWNAILSDRETPPHEEFVSCDFCELTLTTRAPGDECPRCGSTLDHDITPRFAPALAAVAAAIPLCLPAYDASVMINQNLTGIIEHTVLGTVQLLADRGYWELGVIVLVAGVAIPTVEILGMAWLLLRVRWPQKSGLVVRTRFYRILHRLVRWPMVIPFVAAIAAPIIDYQGIDDIVAGPGATPLFAVIALAIYAVRVFEPRLMWKAGEVR